MTLLAWCAVLLAFRARRSGSPLFMFLVWNLFLAAIPAVAAQLFVWADAGRRHAQQFLWFFLWLLFLPNAPYIITDFIHLTPRPPIPLWYDVAVLLSCAATGLLMGYTSLADVQHVITRRFGQIAGWSTAAVSLLLSGFGIYVGRFLRWNSWDAITNLANSSPTSPPASSTPSLTPAPSE